jgi:hypothetical protein
MQVIGSQRNLCCFYEVIVGLQPSAFNFTLFADSLSAAEYF